MRPSVKIEVTAGTLAAMSDEQFRALRDEVLVLGKWEHQRDPVRVAGSDPVMVAVGGDEERGVKPMFLGIEVDGYVHS